MVLELKKMDVWKQKIQSDIEKIKQQNENQEIALNDLKRITDYHERDIKEIKSTLTEIKEDTKWLRRSITNALIVGIIGGAVAIFYAAIKGVG